MKSQQKTKIIQSLSSKKSFNLSINEKIKARIEVVNENGELEYVCVDPYEVNPCGLGCMPPCINPDE